MIKDKDKSRIQSCVDHINTAVDVDPWAKELVAEMGKEILEQLNNSTQEVKNSNDAISRQAAIDAVGGNEPVGDPSKMDDDDVVKMWERIRIINIINKLPSAQPERKTGQWINANDGKWNTVEVLKCSVCGEIDNRMYRTDNFCPNCGADMREEGGQE